jgi:hypothetical protein
LLYGFVPLETGVARDSCFLGLSRRCRESSFHLRNFGSFQQGCARGTCIALHRSACRGGLQAKRERKLVLQVPEILIEASANIVVKAESVQVNVVRRPPAAGGLPLLL